MSKLLSRLLVFFIGIPIVIGLVFFKAYNHLLLHIAICATSVIASIEVYNIFSNKIKLMPKALVAVFSTLIPFTALLEYVIPAFTKNAFPFSEEIITFALVLCFIVFLVYEIFSSKSFELSLERIAASTFIAVYIGYLLSFISRMTVFTQIVEDNEAVTVTRNISFPVITLFLMMVFLCDSAAWLFGMTMGKNNRNILKASPNKSIAGFIGGIIGSIAAGVAGYYIWPEVFGSSIGKVIILGTIIAFTSIIGDLGESVLKRSADCKDSGCIIPGRGGILDSIDSIIVSAPFYYFLVKLFFGPIA